MYRKAQSFGRGNRDGAGGAGIPPYCGENKFSFSIRTLSDPGNLEEMEYSTDEPHRHSYFELIWVTSGAAFCGMDMEQYTVRNDEIYLIPPGQVHYLKTDEHTRGYLVSFAKEFFHLASGIPHAPVPTDISNHGPNIFIVEGKSNHSDIENILTCMNGEFINYSLLRPGIMSGWLRVLFTYLNGLSRQKTNKSDQAKNREMVSKFYALLEKDFLKKKMVLDYANDLFISPNYLNEMVKRVSGFTASYHIQQRIILEAKRLGMYSTISMKEIAYLLGFEDIAYFSKFFKTFSGSNFRDFKRSRAVCCS